MPKSHDFGYETITASLVVVALLALLVFGYTPGQLMAAQPFRSAWQTIVMGGLAATAAFVIVKATG